MRSRLLLVSLVVVLTMLPLLVQSTMTATGTQTPTENPTANNAPAQGGTESTLVGQCEVCVFVIENKEQHQPYLCRGLRDPAYQVILE